MERTYFWLVFFLIILLNPACAFLNRESAILIDDLSIPLIAHRIETNCQRVLSLEGQGYLIYDSPDLSDRIGASIALQVPDSLILRLRGPVGTTYASLLITGTQITYYNSKENVFYKGLLGEETIRQLTGFDFMKQDVFEFFTGLLVLKIDSASTIKLLNGLNNYQIVVRQMPFSVIYRIAKNARFLIGCTWYDTEGQVFMEKSCEGFNKVQETYIPKVIRYTEPRVKRELTMLYTSRTINKIIAPEHFKITIPTSAKPIKLPSKTMEESG